MKDDIQRLVREETARLSRTIAEGAIDGSSSPEKAAEIMLSENIRGAAQVGVDEALAFLRSHSLRDFEVDDLLMLNSLAVGQTTPYRGLRTFEVQKYGYMSPADLAYDMNSFVCRLRTYGESGDRLIAVNRLFDVHWSVNLRGHYFFDACGRTATILGCWVFSLTCGELPRLPERSVYLEVPKADTPMEFWRSLF